MPYGYNGKILHVDLTQRTFRIEKPSKKWYRTYMGGSSFASFYLLKYLNPGTDPLSPDKIAHDDFASRFGLDLALKDVRLGCEMAESLGVDAKTMKTALEYFKRASEKGLGKQDCNAIFKIIE